MTTYPPQPDYAPQPESNGLGIAGFVVSLCGLILTCGCASPIGLVLSLVALRKEPRGLAIAGTVIGAIGSLMIIPLGIGIMLPALTKARERAMQIRAEAEMRNFYFANQTVPATQAEADGLLVAAGLDFTDDPPRYTKTSEDSFELRWAGFDDQFDTADDDVVTWDASPGN